MDTNEDKNLITVDVDLIGDGKIRSLDIEIMRLSKDLLINLLIKTLYDWEAMEGSIRAEPETGLALFNLISELGIEWEGDLTVEQYIEDFSKQIESDALDPKNAYNPWKAHRESMSQKNKA